MLLFDLKEHLSADFGFLSPIRVKVIFLESVISCDQFWILRHFYPARPHWRRGQHQPPTRGARRYRFSPSFEISCLRHEDVGYFACPTGPDKARVVIIQNLDVFYSKFFVESRDDVIFWIGTIFNEIFGRIYLNVWISVSNIVFVWNDYCSPVDPVWWKQSAFHKLQLDILFVPELIVYREKLLIFRQF